ncbi:MAG: alpha/beta hydrolase [Chloroflexota bacterium]
MKTTSIVSTDGIKIVYDAVGHGEPIILLHGGGGDNSRKMWHEYGYVDQLKTEFTVITIDMRGFGASDKPTDKSAYSISQMCHDVLAVADDCGVEQFSLWGYSFGGNIGRFLANRSDRVRQAIIIGIPMGLAAQGEFREFIGQFSQEWLPIVAQYEEDEESINQLPSEKKELFEAHNIPVFLAWLEAMLDWGGVEPADLQCPALWLSGTENESTMQSMRQFENQLDQSNMQTQTFEGLTHWQEFEQIDIVLPEMLAFTRQNLL